MQALRAEAEKNKEIREMFEMVQLAESDMKAELREMYANTGEAIGDVGFEAAEKDKDEQFFVC